MLGLQLSGVSILFVCQFWASGGTGAPAVRGVCLFPLSLLSVISAVFIICPLSVIVVCQEEEKRKEKEGSPDFDLKSNNPKPKVGELVCLRTSSGNHNLFGKSCFAKLSNPRLKPPISL